MTKFDQQTVYIKTFSTYMMNDNGRFEGLKDFSCIEKINGKDYEGTTLPPFRPSESISTSDYLFFKKNYDYNPVYDLNDPFVSKIYNTIVTSNSNYMVTRRFEKRNDLYLNKRKSDIIQDNRLKNDKNMFYDSETNNDAFYENVSNIYNIIQKFPILDKKYSSNNLCLKATQNITKGTYLDIFRKETNSDNKSFVYHFAEYVYGDGGWIEIPLGNSEKPTNDKRKPANTKGTEAIRIPTNQECYFMLSSVMQPISRIDKIREDIDNSKRVIKFPPLQQIKNTWKTNLKSDSHIVKNTNYNKDDETVIIYIPDYFNYSLKLFKLLRAYSEVQNAYIGENDSESQLYHLTMITCFNKNAWRYLDQNTYKSKLYNSFKEMSSNAYLLAHTAKKLINWILQPEYCEMLCDFTYNKKLINSKEKTIEEYITPMLYLLSKYESTNTFFKKLIEKSIDDYFHVIQSYLQKKRNINMSISEIKSYFERNESEELEINIDPLEAYEEFGGTNFFIELFLPNPVFAEDTILSLLDCLSPYIYLNTNKNSNNNLNYLYSLLKQHFNNKIVISAYKGIKVLTPSTKNLKEFLEDSSNIKLVESIASVIDMVILVRKINENKNEPEEIIQLVKDILILSRIATYCGYKIMLNKANSTALTSSQKFLASLRTEDILVNSKDVLKGINGLIGILEVTYRISCASSFYSKGDKEVAALHLYQAGLAITSIVFLFMGVGGWAILALGIAVFLVDCLIEYYKTDDIEKWIKCCEYGCEYSKLPNETFRYLYDNYLIGYNNSFNNQDFLKSFWKNKEGNNTNYVIQIKTYYKILNDFSFDTFVYKVKENNDAIVFNLNPSNFDNLKKLTLSIKFYNNEKNIYIDSKNGQFFTYKNKNENKGIILIITKTSSLLLPLYAHLKDEYKNIENFSADKFVHNNDIFNYDFKKIDFSKSFLEYYSTDFKEVLISKRIKKINGVKKV